MQNKTNLSYENPVFQNMSLSVFIFLQFNDYKISVALAGIIFYLTLLGLIWGLACDYPDTPQIL